MDANRTMGHSVISLGSFAEFSYNINRDFRLKFPFCLTYSSFISLQHFAHARWKARFTAIQRLWTEHAFTPAPALDHGRSGTESPLAGVSLHISKRL